MRRRRKTLTYLLISGQGQDHHRAVAGAIRKPPSDWKRPPGRPNHTWLRATESDLRPLNIGPSYVRKKAASREHWRSIVDTAMLKKSIIIIIKGIYIAQVRKGHKCAMSAEMAVWLRNCLYLYSMP